MSALRHWCHWHQAGQCHAVTAGGAGGLQVRPATVTPPPIVLAVTVQLGWQLEVLTY